jgi:thymidylate synthase ThyX
MIYAKVIADSKHAQTGTRLTTFEVAFPRWVLAEFNTHKMLSKNSASSRAIPIKANIENILANTAVPVSWGKNQSGMVADIDVDEETAKSALVIWYEARDNAIQSALDLVELGIHKQIANRLIENFTYQKVLVTGTEWDNFFWLRDHKDAQPEISTPARLMLDAYNKSEPVVLQAGEWHLPYVNLYRDSSGILHYMDANNNELSLADAQKISASCAGQISYRKSDDSLEKALRVFDMLNLFDESGDTRKHSSPTEHIGTPIDYSLGMAEIFSDSYVGITHVDKVGSMWSANFKDFIQYRHTIPNESCKNHPDIIKK